MSIKTKYAEKIFNGTKKWEYRKNLPRVGTPLFPSIVVVYSSGKDKAIIGHFTIKRMVKTPLDNLIKITGLPTNSETVRWFKSYYKNNSFCGAIEIQNFYRLPKPIKLDAIKRLIPEFRPPQNFVYLKKDDKLLDIITIKGSVVKSISNKVPD